jgi:drug/metabolite transporter (DMT)-like permease
LQKVFLRSALLSFVSLATSRGEVMAEVWNSRHRALLLLRGSVGFVALSCYYRAAMVMPLANLAVISRFHPLLSAGAASVLFRRSPAAGDAPLGRRWTVVLAAGAVGVVMVAGPAWRGDGGATEMEGPALAVLAAVFTSAAFLAIRSLRRRGVPGRAVIFAFHACGAVLAAATAPLTETLAAWKVPSFQEGAWLIGTAAAMQGAQLSLTALLARRGVGRAAPSSFLVCVWTTVFGCMLGQGLPPLRVAAGCALIVGPLAWAETLVGRTDRKVA